MFKIKLLSIIVLIICCSNFIKAQELDLKETAEGLAKMAYFESKNIKAGVGYQSYLMKYDAGFGDKLNFTPNALSYFISFTSIDKISEKVLMSTEVQLGQRIYTATPALKDTVSLLNCEEMKAFFITVPIQLSFRHAMGNNIYWAFNPGMYFDFLIGSNVDELKNGSLTGDLNIAPGHDDQMLKMLDIGAIMSIELGFRAFYVGSSYRIGLRNLAPESAKDLTIRNNGGLNVYAGYRFATKMGKADADKVKKFVP